MESSWTDMFNSEDRLDRFINSLGNYLDTVCTLSLSKVADILSSEESKDKFITYRLYWKT